jgi:hypothetical protein
MRIRSGMYFVLALATVGSVGVVRGDVDPALREVLMAIGSQEREVHCIRFEAKGVQEAVDAKTGARTPAGGASFLATHEVMPGERVKMLNVEQSIKCTDPTIAFLLNSYDVAYDGKMGTKYERRLGSSSGTMPVSRGSIMEEAPFELGSLEDADAWRASFFGWQEWGGTRSSFSKRLADAAGRGDVQVKVNRGADGVAVYEVTLKQETGHTTFWLDGSRGCAMTKIEQFNYTHAPQGSEKRVVEYLRSRTVVGELVKTPSGVYYPGSVVADFYRATAGGQTLDTRMVSTLDHVEINPEDVDEQYFSVPFPADAKVNHIKQNIVTVLGK